MICDSVLFCVTKELMVELHWYCYEFLEQTIVRDCVRKTERQRDKIPEITMCDACKTIQRQVNRIKMKNKNLISSSSLIINSIIKKRKYIKKTDTELILQLIMSFSLWDTNKNKTFLSNDPNTKINLSCK